MKVLFCTSESMPFAASGGLADVSSALPKSLNELDVDCRVVMPLYEGISNEFKNKMEYITNFFVPVSWRQQYCGVFTLEHDGVIYYFLDNEYYFKRNNLYGYDDDAERFTFFSRAVLEMISHIDYKPDIIHSNDWQTALVPVYYSLFYVHYEWYYGIKNIFTIHNIQYQGKYGMEIIDNVVGIPAERVSIIEFDNCANFMKGAIESADIVTTVSPTYAKEILHPWFSYGLDSILKDRSFKVCGILNGIDDKEYNPQTDNLIYENYSFSDIQGKFKNKQLLKDRLFLEQKDVPLIGMVTRLVEQKGIDLVVDALETLLNEEDVQFVILGSGQYEYEKFFFDMQNKYKGKVCACYGFVPELSHKIYAASDLFLMPSKTEPCGLSQMIALRYGSIPIVRETGGLFDSVKDSGDEIGNGFTFKNYQKDDMLYAIKRAVWGYKNKEGFNILRKRAMKCDNSFKKSARKYLDIYNTINNHIK